MITHILITPMHEVSRHLAGDARWCFSCVSHQMFEYVVKAPDDPMSYYGPTHKIQCTHCKRVDGDLFPGRYREWE